MAVNLKERLRKIQKGIRQREEFERFRDMLEEDENHAVVAQMNDLMTNGLQESKLEIRKKELKTDIYAWEKIISHFGGKIDSRDEPYNMVEETKILVGLKNKLNRIEQHDK